MQRLAGFVVRRNRRRDSPWRIARTKQLTAGDRLLIARRIGKSRSTLSREMKRNAIEITAEDRYFNVRISRLWNDEEFDRFLLTQPEELWRRTIEPSKRSRSVVASFRRRANGSLRSSILAGVPADCRTLAHRWARERQP